MRVDTVSQYHKISLYTHTCLGKQYSVKLVMMPRQWGDWYVPQVHATGSGPANLAPLGTNNAKLMRAWVTHIPILMSVGTNWGIL